MSAAFALEDDAGRLTSKWNGCPRWSPPEPFAVLHCTESRSAASTIRYFKGMRNRFAGYHAIIDVDGAVHWLANPRTQLVYGSGVRRPRTGGNAGIQLSIAYCARDWRRAMWRQEKYRWMTVFTGVARAVLDAEEMCGFDIPRVFNGDPVGRRHSLGREWDNCPKKPGFWSHADIDPSRRTDPAWSRGDWDIFFKVLAG